METTREKLKRNGNAINAKKLNTSTQKEGANKSGGMKKRNEIKKRKGGRIMADCFSLPNAAKLVEELRDLEYAKGNALSWVTKAKMRSLMLEAADIIEQLLQKAVEDDAAIALIRKKAEDEIEALLAENAKLKAERDAAMSDINRYCRFCIICKHAKFTEDYRHNSCGKCLDEDNKHFEWRGVKEEENATD